MNIRIYIVSVVCRATFQHLDLFEIIVIDFEVFTLNVQ